MNVCLAIYCQAYSEEPARPARDGMIPSVDRVLPFASEEINPRYRSYRPYRTGSFLAVSRQ